MDLTQSEQAILKKVNLIYSKCDCLLTVISSNHNICFTDSDSIKLEKGKPTLMDKIKFWFFMITEYDMQYPTNPKKIRLDYRYSKSIVITLINGTTIQENYTGFDLITTSKILEKINNEINTPFKYRV